MTGRAKRKGIEIGAGLLTYIIVWAISLHVHMEKTEMTALFLVPYIILSATTYLEEIKRFRSLKFLDENLLIIAATCGAFFVGRQKEAVGAMLLYQAGKLVEELSLSQTKKSIARFIDIRPEYANLKEAGRERVVEPRDLQPKQIIVLKPGERSR